MLFHGISVLFRSLPVFAPCPGSGEAQQHVEVVPDASERRFVAGEFLETRLDEPEQPEATFNDSPGRHHGDLECSFLAMTQPGSDPVFDGAH